MFRIFFESRSGRGRGRGRRRSLKRAPRRGLESARELDGLDLALRSCTRSRSTWLPPLATPPPPAQSNSAFRRRSRSTTYLILIDQWRRSSSRWTALRATSGRRSRSSSASKKWARDNAVCRGHILATLSDRLFPDYVRHATAREVWQAVARTYDLDMSEVASRRFNDFEFDEGAPLVEQIAHAEALATDVKPPYEDDFVARALCRKGLPENAAVPLMTSPSNKDRSMSNVWYLARAYGKYGRG